MNKRLTKLADLLQKFATGLVEWLAYPLEGKRGRHTPPQRVVQRIVYMPDRRYSLVNTKTGEVL